MMIKTSRQLKDLTRNLAKGNSGKAQFLLRNYAMERFLERMSLSQYKDNFILKGGVLVTAMVGLDMRMTMDIDATIRNFSLTPENAEQIVGEIIKIHLFDAIRTTCKKRGSEDVLSIYRDTFDQIEHSAAMRNLWKVYQLKNPYANSITWEANVSAARFLFDSCTQCRLQIAK